MPHARLIPLFESLVLSLFSVSVCVCVRLSQSLLQSFDSLISSAIFSLCS